MTAPHRRQRTNLNMRRWAAHSVARQLKGTGIND